mgnify:CR=1 FL=1
MKKWIADTLEDAGFQELDKVTVMYRVMEGARPARVSGTLVVQGDVEEEEGNRFLTIVPEDQTRKDSFDLLSLNKDNVIEILSTHLRDEEAEDDE